MKIMAKIKEKIDKHGWKAVLGLFTFYLVRDLSIYVLVPYLLVK